MISVNPSDTEQIYYNVATSLCIRRFHLSRSWVIVILNLLTLQGELTSASAILDFLASPEALDLPGQVCDQNLSQKNKPATNFMVTFQRCVFSMFELGLGSGCKETQKLRSEPTS